MIHSSRQKMDCSKLAVAAALLACVLPTPLRGQPQGRFVNLRPVIGQDIEARNSDPWVSQDELRIYFASQRGYNGPQDVQQNDLWMAERATPNDPFGEWTKLPATINADDLRDTSPFLTDDELTMIYDGHREGLTGLENVLITTRSHDSEPWSTPTSFLTDSFSGLDYVIAAELASDGLTLYFTAGENGGEEDLYQARRAAPTDPFGPPQRLSSLSTSSSEYQQTVSADGLTIIYESDRDADFVVELWAATRESIDEPFNTPLHINDMWPGSEVDQTGWGEFTPYLSPSWPADGSKLYFGAGTDFVDWDLYEVTWQAIPEPTNGVLASLAVLLVLAQRRGIRCARGHIEKTEPLPAPSTLA